jgi:hypothetical protein
MISGFPEEFWKNTPVRNLPARSIEFGETHRRVFLDLIHDAHVGDYAGVPVDEAKRAYEQLATSGHLKTIDVDLDAEEKLPEAARRQKH